MKFTENEEDIFNDVYEVTQEGKDFLNRHAKSGKVSFEDVTKDMIAYSNDDDSPVGLIVAKSKDVNDLKEYDYMGITDEIDEWPDCEGFVAIKLLKDRRDYLDPVGIAIYLYGGNDPSGAYCTF